MEELPKKIRKISEAVESVSVLPDDEPITKSINMVTRNSKYRTKIGPKNEDPDFPDDENFTEDIPLDDSITNAADAVQAEEPTTSGIDLQPEESTSPNKINLEADNMDDDYSDVFIEIDNGFMCKMINGNGLPCGRIVATSRAFSGHIKTHGPTWKNGKGFYIPEDFISASCPPCDVCGQRFVNTESLFEHKKRHPKTFICDHFVDGVYRDGFLVSVKSPDGVLCGKAFSTRESLDNHLFEITGDTTIKHWLRCTVLVESKNAIPCPTLTECGMRFLSMTPLYFHARNTHGTDRKYQVDHPFECQDMMADQKPCGRTFGKLSDWKYHREIHTKPVFLNENEVVDTQESSLNSNSAL